jgi:hypothetical protein
MPFAIKRIDEPHAQRTGFRGRSFVCGREYLEGGCASRSLAEGPSTKPWATRLVTSLSDFPSFTNAMRRSWPINNAAEAMSAPRTVARFASQQRERCIGRVLVAVRDSGPGIPRVETAWSTHSPPSPVAWHGTVDLPIDRRSSWRRMWASRTAGPGTALQCIRL